MFSLFVFLFSLFSTPLFSNPWSPLVADEAWKEEITYDFENLDHEANFKNWEKTFNKKYPNKYVISEFEAFKTFMINWRYINKFNIANKHTYKLGINQFSDLNTKQFRRYIHGGVDTSCFGKLSVFDRIKMKKYVRGKAKQSSTPTSIDWTNVDGKSYVTPVKNQGSCGSCWAFSSTGSTESRSAIATQTTGSSIIELSEQELIDCSRSYGNMGCQGGLMDDAFKYIRDNKGLCTETDYPYKAHDGICHNSCTHHDPISGYTDVKKDSETSLVDAVAEGPVSVAIEADQTAFQHYRSGVLDGTCGTSLDHGVLVVGYGTDSGSDFWKVKNSWGSTWGEEGYVRICRNCNKNGNRGECGILMTPSFPISSQDLENDKSLNIFQRFLKHFRW